MEALEDTPTISRPRAVPIAKDPTKLEEGHGADLAVLARVVGSLVEKMDKPDPTWGDKIKEWFSSLPNLVLLVGFIYGMGGKVQGVMNKIDDNEAFQIVAIKAHEDISAALASQAKSTAELRDEVIEMRGRETARNGG